MPYCLAAIFYFIFLLVPGTPGPYDGIPLDRLHELLTLAILPAIFLFIPAHQKKISRFYWILVLLIIGKAIIGHAALQEGLIGTYYSGSGAAKMRERSTEFFTALPNATRIDNTINFKQEGYPKEGAPFPLWFLNDNTRFNGTGGDIRLVPFSAKWQGYLHVPEGGKTLTIASDGTTTMNVRLPKTEAVVPIAITYTASATPYRFLTLSWNGSPATIVNAFYQKPYTIPDVQTHRVLKILDLAVKSIALVLCILLLKEGFAKTPLAQWFASSSPYLFASYAAGVTVLLRWLVSDAQSSYFNFFSRGNDDVTYETYARHIQFTGDWSMRAIETGSYYYQPYYYFITLFHYLGGEGIFAVIALQGIAFCIAIACLALIGKRMMGTNDTLKQTWPLFILFPLALSMPFARIEVFRLFPSVIGALAATVVGALLLAAKNEMRPMNRWLYFFAGIALGCGIVNRFNFLSWIPFIALWMCMSFGKRCALPLMSFSMGIALIIGPMIVRNKIVDGNWRMISRSNPTVNFMQSMPSEANAYAGNYNNTAISKKTAMLFDGRATPAIEWIMDHPKAYARAIIGKLKTVFQMFPWQFMAFLLGSFLYLCVPRLVAPHARRADYILIGIFPLMQIASVILMSNNSMRYHFSAALYMALWAPLLVMMVQNAIKALMRARKRREA